MMVGRATENARWIKKLDSQVSSPWLWRDLTPAEIFSLRMNVEGYRKQENLGDASKAEPQIERALLSALLSRASDSHVI